MISEPLILFSFYSGLLSFCLRFKVYIAVYPARLDIWLLAKLYQSGHFRPRFPAHKKAQPSQSPPHSNPVHMSCAGAGEKENQVAAGFYSGFYALLVRNIGGKIENLSFPRRRE
jgi:hypothetical protein